MLIGTLPARCYPLPIQTTPRTKELSVMTLTRLTREFETATVKEKRNLHNSEICRSNLLTRMVRVVVLLVLFIAGVCSASGTGAMPVQSMVRIDCCVVSRPPVAPDQPWLVPIGIVMLSLITLQLGFFAIHRRLILQPAFPLAAPTLIHLRC